MPFRVSVTAKIDAALTGMAQLTDGMRDRVVVRTLNAVADATLVQLAKNIRDAGYGVSAADLKARLRVTPASSGKLIAEVSASGRPFPLIKFNARQTGTGVSVSVKNGRKVVPGAFIATMPTGHVGVYKRGNKSGQTDRRKVYFKDGKRNTSELPISEEFGPSVVSMAREQGVQDATGAAIADRLPKALARELRAVSRGFAK